MFSHIKQDYFDFVMTNPPYYSKNDKEPSPDMLRNVANRESTVDLENWLKLGLRALKTKGTFNVIHTADRLGDILQVFNIYANNLTILPIITQENQPIKRVIVSAKKGVKGGTKILPPLVINGIENNKYSKEGEDILYNMQPINMF